MRPETDPGLPAAHAVPLMERMLHLRAQPLFAGLSSARLAMVAAATRERAYTRGELVLGEGELHDAMIFVVSGAVRLSRHGRFVDTAGPGAVVGDLGVVVGPSAGLEARAETAALTLELTRDGLLELLEEDFNLLLEVIRRTSGQLIERLAAMEVAPILPPAPRAPLAFPDRELDLVERLFLLRRMPGFTTAGLDALSELARELKELRLPARERLWGIGEPAGHLLFLAGGDVTCRAPRGWTTLRRGLSLVGALEAIAGAPRWFEATTATEVVALRADVDTLLDVFEDDGETALGFLTHLASA